MAALGDSEAMEKNQDPGTRLHYLLSLRLGEEISVEEFCSEYEYTFNFVVDPSELSENEESIFEALFDSVVWYSPIRAEREKISQYKSEDEIVQAVDQARTLLGISRRLAKPVELDPSALG